MTTITCSRCNNPKGKGKHHVTCKVAGSTTRWEIRTCCECARDLEKRITNTMTKWIYRQDE